MKEITTFAKKNDIVNCSANTDLMLCSLHIAQCRKDNKALLPCRRVCQEFVKDCGEKLSLDLLDFFVAVCHFLPEMHDCIEPPGFKPKYNLSGKLVVLELGYSYLFLCSQSLNGPKILKICQFAKKNKIK